MTPLAALPHVAGCGLRYVENSREIYRDDFGPVFGRDIEKVVTDADSGVVDEHVDGVHEADRLFKCGLHLKQIRDVGGDSPG